MKKELNFGKIAYEGNGKSNAVTIDIEIRNKERVRDWDTLEELHNVPEISICGAIWNARQTDCVCCGQCLDTIGEYIKTPKMKRIIEIWEKYHLNGMNSGTKTQTEVINKWRKENNVKGWAYEQECEYLKSINLFEDRGYKIWTWLALYAYSRRNYK